MSFINRLLISSSAFLALASLSTVVSAVVVPGSASITADLVIGSNVQTNTELNPAIGDITFSNFAALPQLRAMEFSLTFTNLDTDIGLIDHNNITLAFNGIDTGLKLNGFDNGFFTSDTEYFQFNFDSVVGDSILASLVTNSGFATVSLIDATSSPANQFVANAGNFSFTLHESAIPFTPVQSMGLILVGLGLAARQARRGGLRGLWAAVRS